MPAWTFEQHRILAELYRLIKEEKQFFLKAKILFEKKYSKSTQQLLMTKNILKKSSYGIQLTEEGLAQGFRAARIISVFQNFCHEMLELSQKETDAYIEKIFEDIDDDVLEKYCAILGHAHKDIIPGECCRRAKMEVNEKIMPLSRLPINTSARIVNIKTNLGAVMHKLFDLGLYPGRTIRIHQLYPAYIVIIDQQEVALEAAIAEFIFVKK
jgi:DtxR family Mn-dependent transcriptional regulator